MTASKMTVCRFKFVYILNFSRRLLNKPLKDNNCQIVFTFFYQGLHAKFLKQGYRHHKHRKVFQNSIDATMIWYPNLMLDSNLFLSKAFRNPNFMVT